MYYKLDLERKNVKSHRKFESHVLLLMPLSPYFHILQLIVQPWWSIFVSKGIWEIL